MIKLICDDYITFHMRLIDDVSMNDKNNNNNETQHI